MVVKYSYSVLMITLMDKVHTKDIYLGFIKGFKRLLDVVTMKELPTRKSPWRENEHRE